MGFTTPTLMAWLATSNQPLAPNSVSRSEQSDGPKDTSQEGAIHMAAAKKKTAKKSTKKKTAKKSKK